MCVSQTSAQDQCTCTRDKYMDVNLQTHRDKMRKGPRKDTDTSSNRKLARPQHATKRTCRHTEMRYANLHWHRGEPLAAYQGSRSKTRQVKVFDCLSYLFMVLHWHRGEPFAAYQGSRSKTRQVKVFDCFSYLFMVLHWHRGEPLAAHQGSRSKTRQV